MSWAFLLYLLNILGYSLCAVSVNRVVVRTPKEGDIGLIFDINIINTANEVKEVLDYRIRPDGECCVNVSTSSQTFRVGKVVGGSFGHIEPGAMKTVSVIWPTTAVFNRVGYCDVIITSINGKNVEKEITQKLDFDTRFETIDSAGSSFTRRADFVDCGNWDLNYFNSCCPVNCEEKYLGKRSFYNSTTKQCEVVPKCSGKDQVYDIYSNECTNLLNALTAQDIDDLKDGIYEDNNLQLKPRSTEVEYPEFHEPDDELYMFTRSSSIEAGSIWEKTVDVLGMVFATILFYTCLCFVVFLIVNRISGNPSRRS